MAITPIAQSNVPQTKLLNNLSKAQNSPNVSFGSTSGMVQKVIHSPISVGTALAAAAMITLAGCTGGSSPSGPEVTEPENPIIDTTETNSSSSSIDSIVVNSSSSKGDTTAVSSSSTASSSSAADTTKSSSSVASSSSTATSSSVASSSSSAVVPPEVIATVTTMNAILDAAGIGPSSPSAVFAKPAVATMAKVAPVITITPSGAAVPAGTLLQLNTSEVDGFTQEYVLSGANDDGTLTYEVKTTNTETGRVTVGFVDVVKINENAIILTEQGDSSDPVKYVLGAKSILKYCGDEYLYTLTKIRNGSLVLSDEDGIGDTVNVSTVYQSSSKNEI